MNTFFVPTKSMHESFLKKSYQKNKVWTNLDKIGRTGTGLFDDRISGAVK